MRGRLILVVGPSGSGKSALLAHLQDRHPEILFPLSCTTRAARPGEVEGEKYHFITKEEFQAREERGEFLEWAQYGHNYYGVIKAPVMEALAQGKTVVREVEVQGARQILETLPAERVGLIFIDAGSWETLEKRITARAPMSEPELLARRKRYEDERAFMPRADVIVNNPDGGLEQAKKDFEATVMQLSK